MPFEQVHTVIDWYDGPRRGVATVNGRPHVYESCWSDIDSDDDDVFVLSPISGEVFSAAIEDWEISTRWEVAYKSGKTTIETHPALPEDRVRHAALVMIQNERLVIDERQRFAATVVFRYHVDAQPRIEAEWTIIDYVSGKDKRDKYRSAADADDPNQKT